LNKFALPKFTLTEATVQFQSEFFTFQILVHN